MIKEHIPYLIPPILSLSMAYTLAILSLTRGRINKERIMLALICFFWSLLSWAFIWHNIMTDTTAIMKAERIVHTFYVFVPAMTLLFFQIITGEKNRYILAVFFSASTSLVYFVQTDYYFYDFYSYSWGMIAKGGPALHFFSIFNVINTLYIFYFVIKKLKSEKNSVVRLKIKYMFISYFLIAIMTISNIPAMNGINFYPMSNLIFIPLGIMTYGILKYRLIEISSAARYSIAWIILLSIIIIPDILIFNYIAELLNRFSSLNFMLIIIAWFIMNYFYFNKIPPLIDRVINKKKFELTKNEDVFIKNLALLKNPDDLKNELLNIILKNLDIKHAEIYIRTMNHGIFSATDGKIIDLHANTVTMLADCGDIMLQKSILESKTNTGSSGRMIISLLESKGCEYIIPLTNQNELIALIVLAEKENGKQISSDEYSFIRKITSYASIALANSVIYKNLTDLNDNLEQMVNERTTIIEKQKSELENDIEYARRIQRSLLPHNIPFVKGMKIAYKYEPVMGIGGDFIDIHYREGMNEVGLFICDVSGHGASSAMIASMVKMSLHSWGKFIQNPAGAFPNIRKQLSGNIGDNFLTAFMCCINLEDGTVTSACAGHPPMIILRKSGSIEMVKPSGIIIGDFGESSYEEVINVLNPGDRIVLYTDGVTEARSSASEMIGEERFAEMLKKNSHFSPGDICSRIYDDIFSAGSRAVIDDDFALLVAEYTG